jgi:hypothetical protein
VGQGRLLGMGQSPAHQWMHVLLPALLVALRALGDAPARSLTALAQRRGRGGSHRGHAPGGGIHTPGHTAGPPGAHDGTERRLGRPPDPPQQAAGYSGKQKDPPIQNVLLVQARRLRPC